MIKQNLVEKFLDGKTGKSYMKNGAGHLSKIWKERIEDIIDSRDRARQLLQAGGIQVEEGIIDEKDYRETGGKEFTYASSKPLSPKEIDELAGVDNINNYVSYSWLKSHKNGMWTYSIAVKKRVKDFYEGEELKRKLEELFPDITPVSLPKVEYSSPAAMVILISDDHAGSSDNKNTLYGNTWSPEEYKDRLLKVSGTAKGFFGTFEECHLISLGDQLNGWNSQTTRGGHEVKSLSNKEQFDAYIQGRVAFYNDLFSSGISGKYYIHEVENSNHSGLGLSYMANQYLNLYLESKFPQVKLISYQKAINHFTYGKHVIGFAHGKDEGLMVRPMPLFLNDKTDTILSQYFDFHGFSQSRDWITLYKGDLHTYGVNRGKFGRYINIPSILGSTDYTELNYGDAKPGALMEFYFRDEEIITSTPIWFK